MILVVDFIEISYGKFSYENIRLYDDNLFNYSRLSLKWLKFFIRENGYHDIPLNESLTKFRILVDMDNPIHLEHDDWISDFILWYKENYTVEENILKKYSDN